MSYATLMVYVEPDRMPVERVRLAAHLANNLTPPSSGCRRFLLGDQ